MSSLTLTLSQVKSEHLHPAHVSWDPNTHHFLKSLFMSHLCGEVPVHLFFFFFQQCTPASNPVTSSALLIYFTLCFPSWTDIFTGHLTCGWPHSQELKIQWNWDLESFTDIVCIEPGPCWMDVCGLLSQWVTDWVMCPVGDNPESIVCRGETLQGTFPMAMGR